MNPVYESATVTGDIAGPFPVKAATLIAAGALFAIDATGHAVAADAATGVYCAGRATTEADNQLGADGDIQVYGERLAYVLANSEAAAVSADEMLKPVFLEDEQTVRAARSGTEPVAGVLIGFDASGDPIVDVRNASLAGRLVALEATVAALEETVEGLE